MNAESGLGWALLSHLTTRILGLVMRYSDPLPTAPPLLLVTQALEIHSSNSNG